MKYIKLLSINIISIILLLSLVTLLYYFVLIHLNIFNCIKIFITIISIFICSFIISRKNNKKGIITGSIYSLCIIIPLFISSLIFNKFNTKLLLYYLIIITSSMLGGCFSKKIKRSN